MRQRGTRGIALAVALTVVAFAAATALDGWAYRHLVRRTIYDGDFGRMLRIAGFLTTWAIVSLALVLCDPLWRDSAQTRWRRWRGVLPFVSAVLAGLTGQVLKLLIRRERPEAHAGAYAFRSWFDHPFSGAGLGLPSSHGVVAFGALAMLAHMYPRARGVWFALAAGCAVTRVLARAHFLSDVTLAGIVGILVASGLWHWWQRQDTRSVMTGAAAEHVDGAADDIRILNK